MLDSTQRRKREEELNLVVAGRTVRSARLELVLVCGTVVAVACVQSRLHWASLCVACCWCSAGLMLRDSFCS